MNVAMKSFGFGEKLVRVVERDEAPWFVANDVCAALEIANARHAVSRLDEDEKGVVSSDPLYSTNTPLAGGRQEVTVISESGVYALIFTSRKAVAKSFRKWVTADVLPTLRRDGRYEMPANDEPAMEAYADRSARLVLDSADDFERFRAGLLMVREARIVFGRPAAQRAWALAGLPVLEEEGPQLAGSIHDPLYASIHRWIGDRCEWVPGYRWSSTGLFEDYLRWCRGFGADEPASHVAFGKYLSRIGVGSIKSNGIYRVGLKLRPG